VLVTGVQAVGGRGYVALAPVVVDDTRPPPASTAQEAGPAAVQAARAADAEAVVFPRRGASVDQRPDELKYARASARYREHARVERVTRER
jgi:hypothetical protein